MEDERKGFLLPEQEQLMDELIQLKGVAEAFDGIAIKLADNQGLELLKDKIPAEVLPIVYSVIDEIFNALSELTQE